MKKSFCIFILTAAAGLGSILFVFWSVDREKADIAVTETVVEGDVAAAEGIMVEIRTQWEGRLLWNTHYQPGHVQEAASCFDFSSQKIKWSDSNPRAWSTSLTESGQVGNWRDRSAAYVDMDVASTHFGLAETAPTGYRTYSDAVVDNLPFSRLLRAAEEQTAAGETRTVTLRLRDYYDYYPLGFSVAGEDGIVYYEAFWGEFATDYFKLMIPGDEMLQVKICKDQEGRILALECAGTGEGYFPVITSVLGDTGYYFAFYLEGTNKELEEIQREFGGRYAVYWLPLTGQPEKGGKEPRADLEQIKKAAQLPEGSIPVTMQLDRDGRILYLLALQKEQYILLTYLVDEGDLILRQQLTVYAVADNTDADTDSAAGEAAPGYFRKMTVQEDGILLTWQDNRFAFIVRDGEECRFWCADVFPAAAREDGVNAWMPAGGYLASESAFPYEHAFAFDGTRLALAAFEGWDSLDSRLLVYREGQLVYSGCYQYSGELDAALGMDDRILPWGNSFSRRRRDAATLKPLHVSIQ